MKWLGDLRYGRVVACWFCFVGVFLWGLNLKMLHEQMSFYPILFAIGISAEVLGFVLIVLPGGNFTLNDCPGQTVDLIQVWRLAPMSHRIAWIIAAGIGFAVGMKLATMVGEGKLNWILYK